MSDESEYFDENLDNPFDLMEMLGWTTSEQDDDLDDDDDYEDDLENGDDLDDDVYFVSHWLRASALGYWGNFPNGAACDGSRDLTNTNFPESEELPLFVHVRLVMDMRHEERLASDLP